MLLYKAGVDLLSWFVGLFLLAGGALLWAGSRVLPAYADEQGFHGGESPLQPAAMLLAEAPECGTEAENCLTVKRSGG